MGRQIRWMPEREYSPETKALVHRFIHDHPFEATGQGQWTVSIPEGQYRIVKNMTFYIVEYRPFLGQPAYLLRVNHRMHDDDAFCRVAIAVARDANRRMQ